MLLHLLISTFCVDMSNSSNFIRRYFQKRTCRWHEYGLRCKQSMFKCFFFFLSVFIYLHVVFIFCSQTSLQTQLFLCPMYGNQLIKRSSFSKHLLFNEHFTLTFNHTYHTMSQLYKISQKVFSSISPQLAQIYSIACVKLPKNLPVNTLVLHYAKTFTLHPFYIVQKQARLNT